MQKYSINVEFTTYMMTRAQKAWTLWAHWLKVFQWPMAVDQADHTLPVLPRYVPPTLMDQLASRAPGEVINSSLVPGPSTWLQRVSPACKQQHQHLIQQALAQAVSLLYVHHPNRLHYEFHPYAMYVPFEFLTWKLRNTENSNWCECSQGHNNWCANFQFRSNIVKL